MELGSPVLRIRRDLDHGEDRISKLPNEVLVLIFAFLPTKEVGRTSILSKRWRYVWTYHPILEFSDLGIIKDENDDVCRLVYFKDSVDHALFLHRGSVLKRCSFNCTIFDISPWISAALCCNVQELSIETLFANQALPPSLFSCGTLVVLKIEGPFLVNLPSRVSLPGLKTVSLDCVMYEDDLTMQRLFSSCPLLEDLKIRRNQRDGVEIASIASPSLKELYLVQTFLGRIQGYYKTVIDAPNLEYLQLNDRVSNVFDVNFSDSLVDVAINGGYGVNILPAVSHVRELLLSGDAFGGLSNAILPVFHNLFKMELGVSELGAGWDFLSNLLSNTPNLKTLVFGEGLLQPDDLSESPDRLSSFDWEPPESPPACLQLYLKEIKIHKFVGRQCECFLIRYLLDNGFVLDKMTIYWSNSVPVLTKSESEVMSYERASPGCVVEFLAPSS